MDGTRGSPALDLALGLRLGTLAFHKERLVLQNNKKIDEIKGKMPKQSKILQGEDIFGKKLCLAQLTANFVIMDKLLQFLLFLLPFVVESALVRNNIHILRKKILGRNIYDHHVKPDGKVDVSFGIERPTVGQLLQPAIRPDEATDQSTSRDEPDHQQDSIGTTL